MTKKEHWDDTRRRHWDDIIGATGMTTKGYLDNTVIKKPVSATCMTSFFLVQIILYFNGCTVRARMTKRSRLLM
ncbi:WPE palindromic element domain-containing protein [Wolbachia endosymbiont of Cantharis cryptica]|uniref:WPE palindromic element domain-containing protein n=1 Tax=Wolbachia endosymbiont of Cantharis cryptica TaxID=3066132 RepID=UPI00376F031A